MGIDPLSFARLWRFDWVKGGSDRLLAGLGTGNAIVEEQTAKGLGLKVGQRFTVLTAAGRRAAYTVSGEYHDPVLLNGILLSDAGLARLTATPQPFIVLAGATAGAGGPQTLQAIKAALADLPTAKVQTAAQYKATTVGMVNQLVNLLYGLLAMSVLISVFGIVNTLVLAVYERTREIGLSRAIGMSRRQVRATVRYESVITSRHRRADGHRGRRAVRLDRDHQVRGLRHRVRHPGRTTRGVRHRGRAGGRCGGHPAGAARGPHRHPAGHTVRVTGEGRGGAPQARRPAPDPKALAGRPRPSA